MSAGRRANIHTGRRRSGEYLAAAPSKPRHGDPRLPARFWAKAYEDASGCWLWTAGKLRGGYGAFGAPGGGMRQAHRYSYEQLVGPIPAGLTIDHLCRVRACVNPAHMEPVTRRDNTMRGESAPAANARKTHCPRGHSYSGENLYVSPRGERFCRTCVRMHAANHRARRIHQ